MRIYSDFLIFKIQNIINLENVKKKNPPFPTFKIIYFLPKYQKTPTIYTLVSTPLKYMNPIWSCCAGRYVPYLKIPLKHMMTGRLEMKGQQGGLTLLFEEAVITAFFFSDGAREKGGSWPRGKMGWSLWCSPHKSYKPYTQRQSYSKCDCGSLLFHFNMSKIADTWIPYQ